MAHKGGSRAARWTRTTLGGSVHARQGRAHIVVTPPNYLTPARYATASARRAASELLAPPRSIGNQMGGRAHARAADIAIRERDGGSRRFFSRSEHCGRVGGACRAATWGPGWNGGENKGEMSHKLPNSTEKLATMQKQFSVVKTFFFCLNTITHICKNKRLTGAPP